MNDIATRDITTGSDGRVDEIDIRTPVFSTRIGRRQFHRQSDPAVQKDLFARYVKRIVIETSSYCNRRCVFCPNADGSRLKARHVMPEAMFRTVIDDLAEIGYARTILFHLYNEPLADPAIFDRISYARSRLPKAILSFNSNGDYIRAGTLKRLAEAGLTNLHISIYGPEHGVFDKDYVSKRMQDMAELCGLSKAPVWRSEIECLVSGVFEDGDARLPIGIQAKDFNQSGYDRGGLVDFEQQELPDRLYPCPSPFDEFLLTWNGVAVPCCNLVGDRPEHQRFGAGEVTTPGTIFDIYANGPLVEWRRSLMRFDAHAAPCNACTRQSVPIAMLDIQHVAFNEKLCDFMDPLPPLGSQVRSA